MTERQAWLKAAKMIESGKESFMCFAIRRARGLSLSENDKTTRVMITRMDKNKPIDAGDDAAWWITVNDDGYEIDNDGRGLKRVAFCKSMAAQCLKESKRKKAKK